MNIGQTNLSNRNAWIKQQLAELPAGSRILDAGAGELQWKPYCSHLDYVSQDLAQYDGNGDGKGLQCKNWNGMRADIICDIIDIPEPSCSFDAILCSEVLDHVPAPALAIMEFRRLLKPGGILLITESFCGLTNQSPFFYYTGLADNFYHYYLKDFDITITHNGNYYEWIAQEIHRLASWNKISPYAKQLMLYELGEAAQTDTKSNEILCYGLLVKAVKK
jgi:SAM-dependent methyltransferase